MSQRKLPLILFCLAIVALTLCIYLPGLHNGLVFDDARLTDGEIMENYGNLLQLKQRMLSYGSFVWLQSFFGEGWWKQRLVNLAIHFGVVAGLFTLFRALLTRTPFPAEFEAHNHFVASRTAAVAVGTALFAVNPMAVYAVAYLVQRSILLATFFTVWALYAFVRGLTKGGTLWCVLATVLYVLAVLSKEHAIMAAGLAVPLYIHLKRPPWRRVAALLVASLTLVTIAVALLLKVYGAILGVAFDVTSVIFQQQLELVRPGVGAVIYPLSALNQSFLFFKYGLLWLVPNPQWMSIDLRPPFPLSGVAFPQVLGAIGFLALSAASVWLVLRRRGPLALVGVCLLMPLLLCLTEFTTVWVQDPFVLYRSYLWAIALPGLIAVVLTGFQPKAIYAVGAMVGMLFTVAALERVMTFENDLTVWSDAVEKVREAAPANAVGRWRPYLNRGAYYQERASYDLAHRDFAAADALGELKGSARFNIGVNLQLQKRHAEAIAAFDNAASIGKDDFELRYQRGESHYALARYQAAFDDFSAALARPMNLPQAERQPVLQAIQLRRAESAIYVKRFDEAIADYRALAKVQSDNPRVVGGLGMAQIGGRDLDGAVTTFDQLLANGPDAQAFYGRALARYYQGNKAASLQDLDRATALDPRNPNFAALRTQLTGAK